MIRNRPAIFVAAILFSLLTLSVGAENLEVARVTVTPSHVDFESTVPYARARLAVSGPAGIVLEETFVEGEEIHFFSMGLNGLSLVDGYYRYTLLLFTKGAASGAVEDVGELKVTGVFRIQDGLLGTLKDPRTEGSGTVRGSEPVPQADHVFDDDVIVEGSVCSSGTSACAGGEDFSHDAGVAEIKLVGDPVSIWFADDQDKDFGIEVTADTLTILDEDTNTEPFLLEAGAPNHALHVDSTGAIGFGTATPAQEIHLLGASPDFRLEHSTTGNVWDIRGSDDLIFYNVDDGSGNGGAGAVLTLQDDSGGGKVPGVGIFESDPAAQLHVGSTVASSGVAKILVEAAVGTPSIQLAVENDSAAGISIKNGSVGSNGQWEVVSSASDNLVILSKEDTATEFALDPDGNLTILGALTRESSRASKHDFESVDGREVLHAVLNLPILEWSYKGDRQLARHVGPMAEDFYAAFGLSASGKGISTIDTTGVAIAAFQGLYAEIAEGLAAREAEITRLRVDLAGLQALMELLVASGAVAPAGGSAP